MSDQTLDQLDDDLLVTNPSEWRRRFSAQQQVSTNAAIASVAGPFASQMAATAATLAKRDPANADVADKWWTEVDAMVAPIPEHMRSQALYDQAAKMARANHIEEIAEERAAKLAAAATGVEGVGSGGVSGAAGSAGVGDPAWDKIKASAMGARMLERYGKAKLVAAANAMGGLEKYAEYIAGSRTEFDPSHPSRMYTELI